MLGSRIAALRIRKGWSQAELARNINISPSAVGMYEQGRREPSLQILIALSREFGVTVEYLLNGSIRSAADCDALAYMSVQKDYGSTFTMLSREDLAVLLTTKLMNP